MRNWFITGVSTGLGRELARAALARGDTVVGTVRQDSAIAEFEALAAHGEGARAIGLVMDVTDHASVSKAVAHAEAETGGIDVLVNNAGLGYTGAVEETPIEDARALFDVNLWGALAVLQAALPAMRERRAGRVLSVGSVSGLAPWNGTGIYGASKYAMHCMTRALAQELAPLGIKVTYLAPGGMRTEFAAQRLLGAEPRIPDYAETGHVAREVLQSYHGREPSDPALMAEAIVDLVDEPSPPEILVLGKDAYGYATAEFEALLAAIERDKAITLDVAAEPVAS